MRPSLYAPPECKCDGLVGMTMNDYYLDYMSFVDDDEGDSDNGSDVCLSDGDSGSSSNYVGRNTRRRHE
jgi:hypothetical protein